MAEVRWDGLHLNRAEARILGDAAMRCMMYPGLSSTAVMNLALNKIGVSPAELQAAQVKPNIYVDGRPWWPEEEAP